MDKLDRNPSNNNKSNLRRVTASQNSQNKTKRLGTTSQYIGVSFIKAKGKWKACIHVYGITRHIGLFDEEKTAALASIEEGLTNLDNAIKIRPSYFDAMEYQNLLWREKAKFEKDDARKADLIRQAYQVSEKALALRLRAQQEEAARPKKLGTIGGK